jgi:hypothetical protein
MDDESHITLEIPDPDCFDDDEPLVSIPLASGVAEPEPAAAERDATSPSDRPAGEF